MGKLSFTWSLMGASWQVLKKDKELLVFPLISGICVILVALSFVLPMVGSGMFESAQEEGTFSGTTFWVVTFLFYLANYFVIIFFNTAVVACAVKRLRGGDPTVSDGLSAAAARLPLIFGWALLSASVGLVLRMIEERFAAVGTIVSGLLGLAWSAASFLVIPVLVVENKGPIEAFKESAKLLRKTWGESLVGNFSFGLLFFLLAIPAALLVMGAVALKSGAALVTALVIAGVYVLILSLAQSVLQAIFQSAVYLYAKDGEVPRGFENTQIERSMRHK